MVAPTCFGITLPSSGSVPTAFWEMLNRGVVDRILWMGMLCLVTWCMAIRDHHTPRHWMCYQVKFITRSVKCMVTTRWVMAWLGNGFRYSMKNEQTCTMREPVYDQVHMASTLLSKRRRESFFWTICNGGWTEVNKRLTKWNPTEHTMAFWTRGLRLHHCQSVWMMECLIKWCDAPRH
jgi:hypothetical protein